MVWQPQQQRYDNAEAYRQNTPQAATATMPSAGPREGAVRPQDATQVQGAAAVYGRPRTSEVIKAVESLYRDQLKPFGRILLKRIRENAAAAATAARGGEPVDVECMPLIDPKCLRRICESCTAIRLEPEEGKEYSIALVGRSAGDFVDVTSPEDPYPESLWEEAAAYFESLAGDGALLPGGRYACAQALTARALPFLKGRSLGEVCHIVQLALSKRRLLGYRDGSMVPFSQSVDCLKAQCAVWQQPMTFSKRTAPDLPLATWEQTRACLWEILNEAGSYGAPGVITLSNVKRLFRARYNLELSETSLGHSRLNELLQDPRLADVCTAEMRGKTQVVVQKIVRPPGVWSYGAGYWPDEHWSPAFGHDHYGEAEPRYMDPSVEPWRPSGEAELAAEAAFAAACDSAASSAGAGLLPDYMQHMFDLSEGREAVPTFRTTCFSTVPDPVADAAAVVAAHAMAMGEAWPPAAGSSGEHMPKVVVDLISQMQTMRRSSICTSRSTSDGNGSDEYLSDAESSASRSGDLEPMKIVPRPALAAFGPPPGL
mmetsp:Transcript_18406/g.52794  ORF Transcript_18406/g.52794 Transcript_18406/m.52794 type:complete len:543 (-) Transcript_18406:131-1759(-)|eukprot:CAMPEP_0170238036 /NCGR_PEP_ID=MMETSP0116_2-20130129/18772_1 /TAXON_ID=400756 /ORGANISM="Durinskia baltica, Strain CSIRO CS-38" /LENGTH=542 /DNA_ID=CAMNT_0010488847 /DNA_START=78 /DNA_END=1706 /DNA_ORIENTATION=+